MLTNLSCVMIMGMQCHATIAPSTLDGPMSEEQVRLATPDDEDDVMQLLHVMHAEGGLMPLDEMSTREMFQRAFHRKGAILGVIGGQGDIKAMIFLLIGKFWYTQQFHLEELFNFVRPDKRGREENYAVKMINFAKKCATETKLPLVIGVLTNTRMEGKVRLYRRNLGYPAGAFFVHNAHWINEPSGKDFWRKPFPGNANYLNGNGEEHDNVR